MATKKPSKNIPTIELAPAGGVSPERCPDSFCAVATNAMVSYWGDDQSIARKSGDGALETVATAPKGAYFIHVATSPNGARFAVVRSTDSGEWRTTLYETDATQRELSGVSILALCDDGRTWVADNKHIRCVNREGAAIGAERETGGYIPAHIREDGHAALPAWSGVEVIDPTGAHIKVAAGNGSTKAVTLHPSLPLVAAQFDEEGALRVIDWQQGTVVFEHTAPWCRGAMTLSFSLDGTKLCVAGPGMIVFDLASQSTVLSIPGGDTITGAFSQDHTLLASRARVFNTLVLGSASSSGGPIFSLAFSRDRSKVAYTRDYKAYVMDTSSGEERPGLVGQDAESTRANDVAIIGDDTLVVRGSGYVLFVDIATQVVRRRVEAETAACIAVSPDHTKLALAGDSLDIIDVASGEQREIARDRDGFAALGWTRSGISAQRLGKSSSGPIEVYSADPASGEAPSVCALPKSHSGSAACSFASGGNVVIEASSAVHIGPIAKGKSASKVAMKNLDGPIAFSANGERFAVIHERGEDGGTVYELDASGAPVAIARFDAEDAQCLALSDDGSTLAVGANTTCFIGTIAGS
ncbi:MAG: hypothetical protein U0269_17795 [Polyangiales bacterium]